MPDKRIESVTGVVLAGGKSLRMGTNKALVRVGQQTLVEKCVSTLQTCFPKTILVANRPESFTGLTLPTFPDVIPDLGPLGGIRTALRHVETPAIFVVACDMPFLNVDLIREMASVSGEFDAVAAKIDGKFEPLHAVYHRRILPAIEDRIKAGDYSVYRLLETLRVRTFSESELNRDPDWRKTFLNVNTPEELEKAREIGL
jgi:molybdopterin-guanine dinucleotide biosynthesis protein A